MRQMTQNESEYIEGQDAVAYLEDLALSSDLADIDDISNNVTYLKDLLKVLKKYKKIEEEIGCPLEVYISILCKNISTIFCADGYEYEIQIDTIRKNGFYAHGNHQLVSKFFADYKKTWWLKEDRSE